MKPFAERDAQQDAAEARFGRFMAQLHARKQQRIVRAARGWPFRRWFPIAATAILAAIFFVVSSQSPVIAADELVQHAATVERARPAGSTQRLRITQTPKSTSIVPGIGLPSLIFNAETTDGVVTKTVAVTPGNPSTLVQMLAAHRFAWDEPLSVARFHSWRASLAHKQDVVIDEPGSSEVVLRTRTRDDGDLWEVQLTVERDSYRVKSEAFKFEGGVLQIEASPSTWIRHAPPASVASAASSTSTVPARPARVPGEAALGALAQPDLARWREHAFGHSSASETFMPRLRELTRVAHQHLAALRDLATHDPDAEGAESSPLAHARFQRTLDRQYQTLREDLDALRPSILALTLEPHEKRQAPFTSKEEPAPPDWSRRVHTGLASAAALDRLTADLRAYDDLSNDMRQQLADTFDALWDAVYAPAP